MGKFFLGGNMHTREQVHICNWYLDTEDTQSLIARMILWFLVGTFERVLLPISQPAFVLLIVLMQSVITFFIYTKFSKQFRRNQQIAYILYAFMATFGLISGAKFDLVYAMISELFIYFGLIFSPFMEFS